MPIDELSDLTADLRALGGGRVWSLMVSLFGDLALDKGAQIEGPVLSAIMTGLHIKPEAARVALHRLRKDGWIASLKQGRISHHSLTEKGLRESRYASPRIYARLEDTQVGWQLVIPDPSSAGESLPQDFVALQNNLYVGPSSVIAPPNAAVFEGNAAPDWLRQSLIPAPLLQSYDKLADALTVLARDLPDPAGLSPLEKAVLRCLIVHNWRRLVLKHAPLPQGLIGPDSGYLRSMVLVDDILARTPRPDLRDIAQD